MHIQKKRFLKYLNIRLRYASLRWVEKLQRQEIATLNAVNPLTENEYLDELPDPCTVESELEEAVVLSWLKEQVSDQKYKAVKLTVFDDLTDKEAAKIMNMSRSGVTKLRLRAFKEISKLMEEELVWNSSWT